jgi:putative CocE/NonD family hydrolase
VLIFTSAPLTEDYEATGPVSAVIYAASSAVDTDFTVKLCDVFPDGTSLNLTEGIIRARYRDSITEPTLIEPGAAYEYRIELWPTSNCFGKGHRIRIQVASSSFPRFDRNTNAGGEGGPMNIVVAQQTIYHDAQHPSYILLPVIP